MTIRARTEEREDGTWLIESDGMVVLHETRLRPVPIVPKRMLTKAEFHDRFTTAEQVGINTSTDGTVITIREFYKIVGEVDLDDPRMGPALDYLTGVGLLAAGRKAEITA